MSKVSNEASPTQRKKSSFGSKLFTVLCVVLCCLLALLLAFNMTLVVKGYLRPDMPPSVFGVTPMMVMTNSMNDGSEDCIKAGDLVITQQVDFDTLQVGDIITYLPGKNSVTHRIVRQETINGEKVFITKGDANNAEDKSAVTKAMLVGKYVCRLNGVADVMMYVQKPFGMALVVGIPLVLIILVEALAAGKKNKKTKQKTAELEAELARLRAEKDAQQSAPAETPDAESSDNADDKEVESSECVTPPCSPSDEQPLDTEQSVTALEKEFADMPEIVDDEGESVDEHVDSDSLS